MKHFIRLTDHSPDELFHIFHLADEIRMGKHRDCLRGKTVVLFFPSSSIRTRVTFEKGIHQLGGQSILFPSDTLDKKEDIRDVCGYLNQWADMIIVRHPDLQLVESMAKHSSVPVINAMTNLNHPCEILTDLYSLSAIRADFRKDRYLFVGKRGNIGLTWKEAAHVFQLELEQCCGEGYEIEGLNAHHHIDAAIPGKDIICTDSLSATDLPAFRNCQVTVAAMQKANPGAILNPCPPFFRGEEVSPEVIDSPFFVGYGFKAHLLTVQQAIMAACLQA